MLSKLLILRNLDGRKIDHEIIFKTRRKYSELRNMIKLGCVHSQDMHDTTGHLVLVYFSGGIFSKKPEGIGYIVYRKKNFCLF